MPDVLTDAPAGRIVLADALAASSYGANLVANDHAQSGTNANWSQVGGAVYDPVNALLGNASFKIAGQTVEARSDALMPIDIARPHLIQFWAISSTHVAGAHHYLGLVPYDVDGLSIASQHAMWFPSTLTTLAVDLVPGATTVQLTNAANWINSGTFQSAIIIWDYRDGQNKLWPALTYSRHSLLGAWNAGGIVGNTITLKVPWVGFGSTIPAGTQVSNANAGSSYMYAAAVSVDIPGVWTRYAAIIPADYDTTGGIPDNRWRQGMTQAKMLILANRDQAGNVLNITDVVLAPTVTGGQVGLADAKLGAVELIDKLAG